MTISLLITYYHHLKLVSDLVQAPNTLYFSDDILKLFDQKKVAIVTFMDLSKAFDCVDHDILLSKLKRYGIYETALQWINSYLSDREHFVSCNQTHSSLLNLNIGVPQGSILGPLLFLIYINDIVNVSLAITSPSPTNHIYERNIISTWVSHIFVEFESYMR